VVLTDSMRDVSEGRTLRFGCRNLIRGAQLCYWCCECDENVFVGLTLLNFLGLRVTL
jgi:hypothetical protein